MTGQKKAPNILGGIIDLFILVLLVGGAAFLGYFIGINQKLAPIQLVAPGTPGAIMPGQLPAEILPGSSASTPAATTSSATPATAPATTTPATTTPAPATTPAATKPAPAKKKYWLTSSGTDYVGYTITVKVNDQPVDMFYGPGKTLDITRFVQKGKNSVVFDCKASDDYNKHTGDKNFSLAIQLVSGPSVKEDFAPSAVLFTCKKNAAETKDATEKFSFDSKE